MPKTGFKHTIKEDDVTYFLTMTVVEWADVFTRPVYKDLLIQSLDYCIKEKGLNVFAYVVMTNHIHLLVNCSEPFILRDTIRDFKRHTSKQIVEIVQNEPESRRKWLLSIFESAAIRDKKGKKFKVWKNGNHAIEIFSRKFVQIKVNYIHQNPVKAQFVRKPEDWIYSSMSNYLGEESVLDVKTLTF